MFFIDFSCFFGFGEDRVLSSLLLEWCRLEDSNPRPSPLQQNTNPSLPDWRLIRAKDYFYSGQPALATFNLAKLRRHISKTEKVIFKFILPVLEGTWLSSLVKKDWMGGEGQDNCRPGSGHPWAELGVDLPTLPSTAIGLQLFSALPHGS